MANLVIKNNTGTASSITFDNNSGSDWKIINNNGTFTLNSKSTNLFTMSDAGIATFVNNIILTGKDTHISKTCSAASSQPIFNVIAKDYDIDVLRVAYDTNNPGGYGFSLRYKGTGSGDDNSLQLLADNKNATAQQTVFTVNQPGLITFHNGLTIDGGAATIKNANYRPQMLFHPKSTDKSMGILRYEAGANDGTKIDNSRFLFF